MTAIDPTKVVSEDDLVVIEKITEDLQKKDQEVKKVKFIVTERHMQMAKEIFEVGFKMKFSPVYAWEIRQSFQSVPVGENVSDDDFKFLVKEYARKRSQNRFKV